MDKKQILTGTAKYFRLGSKGNRHKLIIDDVKISKYLQKMIDESIEKHNLEPKNTILDVHKWIRNEKVEVRFV